jgi:hypothetical protein
MRSGWDSILNGVWLGLYSLRRLFGTVSSTVFVWDGIVYEVWLG